MRFVAAFLFLSVWGMANAACAQQSPSTLSVAAFQHRQQDLVGAQVAVSGLVGCSRISICSLSGGNVQIVFDGSRTSGNDQERLNGCNSPVTSEQCPVTVVGIVQRTTNPAIVADHMIWSAQYRPSPQSPRGCPKRGLNGRCEVPYGRGGPY